jgi:iron(III) transport system substrate-binding protein
MFSKQQSVSYYFKEKEMKTLVKLMSLLVLFSFIASCGGAPTVEPTTVAPATKAAATAAPTAVPPTAVQPTAVQPATDVPLSPQEQWLKDNQLGPYFTLDQDWAAIEAAAKKEGKVVVYANSSRIEDQIAIWNEVYPDITLEGYDTEGIATKMEEEQNAGNVVGDVWFNSDVMSMFGILHPKGMILPFIPSEFAAALPVTKEQPFAIARYGGDAWAYNNEQNPDGCPVNNWWQLVDGSYPNNIYFEDPLAEADKISLFVTTIKHGDEMAAAYKDYIGKEWTTDPDYDATTLNAGWLWVKKFARNPKLVVMPGGDEILEAMAALGMTEPAGLANNSYSKMRDTLNGEIAFAVCLGMKPVVGTSGMTLLGIAANAPHVNAAKLYIRFSLTEKGREPWNVLGDWPGRTDIPAPEGAPSFAEAGLWPDDGLLMFQIGSQVRDFWTVNALAP